MEAHPPPPYGEGCIIDLKVNLERGHSVFAKTHHKRQLAGAEGKTAAGEYMPWTPATWPH